MLEANFILHPYLHVCCNLYAINIVSYTLTPQPYNENIGKAYAARAGEEGKRNVDKCQARPSASWNHRSTSHLKYTPQS